MQQFIEKYDEQQKEMEDELQAATASIMDTDCSYLPSDLSSQNPPIQVCDINEKVNTFQQCCLKKTFIFSEVGTEWNENP